MEDKVRFSLDYLAKINYAVYENSLSVIRRMHIENHGEADIPEAVLTITFLPEVIKPFTMDIPRLPGGKSVDLGEIPSEISTEFILSLTEPVKGELTIMLNALNLEVKSALPFEVLPFDQWAGYTDSPEILAAYSTPHHPAVLNLMVRAGEILKTMTGTGSFTAYQDRDPNQVLAQVSAVYTAVCELELKFQAAPADFAQTGQRIRLADELTEKGIGSSLDLTMLFTSVLEAMGLYPLVILMDGHSLPGVWLTGEVFPETINYDSAALTKRMARGMNQIALFESSLVTRAEGSDFNQALEAAAQAMESSDRFILSLDVRRARNLGIKPLPVRILDQGKYVLASRQTQAEHGAVLPKPLVAPGPDEIRPSDKLPKQKVWERKLLDLSLRNALINYRPEKAGIPLAIHDLTIFSRDLLSDAEFSIMHKPIDWTESTSLDGGSSRREAAAYRELAREEYNSLRLRSLLEEAELDERGQKLVKGAKSALEEMGASSLYLGFGLLKWYSLQDPETPRYAPLVLFPVEAETRGHLAGLKLRARDEDGHFNITLLEMLKNDFGIVLPGLDPLPVSEGGIDLLTIFSKVRSAILREKKWDVLEEVNLGLFSFAKFILWSDLNKNLAEFKKNKIVDSLMNGHLTFPAEPIELSAPFIDEVEANRSVIYPVSSDASQSLAVLGSCQGRSFVLHGPPGTGKSQTITNIIANALLQDKRVLFVAQKMAALEVVEKRLNNIGIGSFCLELHSNKARKKAVLDQLEASMKIQRIPKNTSFEVEKEAVRAKKAELNAVIKQLYAVDETGYSIYDLICENTKLADFPKFIDLPVDFDTTDLKVKEAALDHMAKMGAHAGGPYGHPLRGVGAVSFRPLVKEDIQKAGQIDFMELSSSLKALLGKEEGLAPRTLAEVRALRNALGGVDALIRQAPAAGAEIDLASYIPRLEGAGEELARLEAAKSALLEQFSPEFLKADPERLVRDFKSFEQQSVFGKLLRKNPVEKEMALFARNGTADKTKILGILENLADFQRRSEANSVSLRSMAALLPELNTRELTSDLINERTSLVKAALSSAGSQNRLNQLARLIGESDYTDRLSRFETVLDRESPKLLTYLEMTALDESELLTETGDYFEGLGRKAAEIENSLDLLRDWLNFKAAEQAAQDLGLAEFTRSYYQGQVSDQELLPSFKKSVLRKELRRRLEGETQLLNLTGHSLDEKAADLKERLLEMERLERKELYFHLAGKVPNLILERETSKEIAVLQRALRSGARNLSIRNLFAETDQLLRRIAPCMLMSPMSVAQYLKPEANLFDLVVFDEASQIPSSEAIGALGRAREAIIVGDPKQLPPTNFFMTQNNGDDDGQYGDLDNILEDSLALSIPESYLLWHYRSRHESLISFSNRNFYDGSLYTYPSPDDMVSKVTLRQTGGVYERGGERVNRKEAQAVVDEVVRRLKDPVLAKQSMGIVTFSVVQQALIEKLLNEAKAGDEGVEAALQNLPEPLFVKNLENVQGDERDVIMFSIGYGPDEDGKLTMNFGPINQEGGWRRLNVAVSRARLEMVVFTNINPNQFIVSQAQPRGVRDLKAFLEFAEKGSRTLTLAEVRHDVTVENLNLLIAEKLRERGYKVETSIGTSRFKVDLGIVDPNDPERFLLGVLCGGESVRRAESAYDREILQLSVLTGLGWTMHRVFAMDWLDNEEKTTDEIIRKVEAILAGKTDGQKPAKTAAAPGGESLEAADLDTVATASARQQPYKRYQSPGRTMTMDEFLKVNNASAIAKDLLAIIDVEGPISRSLLTKRMRALYELPRVSEKMEKQVELILNKPRPRTTKSGDVPVYWPAAADPAAYDSYRTTLPEDTDRLLRDVAPEEVMSCLREFAAEPVSERVLIREVTSALGYPRLNVDNENFIKAILTVAVLNGFLDKEDQGLYHAARSEAAEEASPPDQPAATARPDGADNAGPITN